MVRTLIGIGGGSIAKLETLMLDRVLVEATGKSSPNALLVPTASMDSDSYLENFSVAYRDVLGCSTDDVMLWERDVAHWHDKLEWADLVYVGGGNTRRMLERWRELGFDLALRSAWEAGKPVGGLSAGLNCWFSWCNTDSDIIDGTATTTSMLPCLGWYDLTVCPHMRDEAHRMPEFSEFMKTHPGIGLGLDDQAAIEIQEDHYRILANDSASGAWLFQGGRRYRMEPFDDFRLLSEIGS
jgi:dipeptidase E